MKTAGILLAAGASRRFGSKNKLLADLGGKPLVRHAAETLRKHRPDVLVAMTSEPEIARLLDGYDIVAPETPDPGQADSLRAGLARAHSLGAERFLIVLGDMPFVDVGLLDHVAERCTATSPSAATCNGRIMPPACFPVQTLPHLLSLRGDRGAAAILKALPQSALVPADPLLLRDIDTPEELRDASQNGVSPPS
ncbi:MAG: nucleotidyltransferase family protein [Pseudomonadota bacterium]